MGGKRGWIFGRWARCVAAVAALSASVARAEERAQSAGAEPQRPSKYAGFEQQGLIELRVGGATMVGVLGATAAYHPLLYLGIGGGIGTNGYGPVYGAYLRVRPFIGVHKKRLHALLGEFGWSGGRFVKFAPYLGWETDTPDPPNPRADFADWLQFDLAYETRSRSGFNVRVGNGLAFLLNPSDLRCDGLPCQARYVVHVIPTFTVGLGYAF